MTLDKIKQEILEKIIKEKKLEGKLSAIEMVTDLVQAEGSVGRAFRNSSYKYLYEYNKGFKEEVGETGDQIARKYIKPFYKQRKRTINQLDF